jgi:hypothetical protein
MSKNEIALNHLDSFDKQIDLSLLNDVAKEQLYQFYRFLIQQQYKLSESFKTRNRLPSEFNKPIKVDKYLVVKREEIYDEI